MDGNTFQQYSVHGEHGKNARPFHGSTFFVVRCWVRVSKTNILIIAAHSPEPKNNFVWQKAGICIGVIMKNVPFSSSSCPLKVWAELKNGRGPNVLCVCGFFSHWFHANIRSSGLRSVCTVCCRQRMRCQIHRRIHWIEMSIATAPIFGCRLLMRFYKS